MNVQNYIGGIKKHLFLLKHRKLDISSSHRKKFTHETTLMMAVQSYSPLLVNVQEVNAKETFNMRTLQHRTKQHFHD